MNDNENNYPTVRGLIPISDEVPVISTKAPEVVQAIYAAQYVKRNPNTAKSTELILRYGHYPRFQSTLNSEDPPSAGEIVRKIFQVA